MTDVAMGDHKKGVALLGYSAQMMESLDKGGYEFVMVVPPDFEAIMKEHGIPHVLWDFDKLNDRSHELCEKLKELGVNVAVPLYEETVEWAGALNAEFRSDPRLFNRYYLFRDKAMMKRKAQMSGIRVGVFEEVENIEEVRKFFNRVNKAMLKLDDEEKCFIHLKPTSAAGSVGHKLIRGEDDIVGLQDDIFPCLLESHLDGQEFSCEIFIHKGKIQFLNITEYIRLGHNNFVPASPSLEAHRDLIRVAAEQLIEAFGIEYGMIHPEFFITPDNKISFGEVAARIPGGHIFDLIAKAYDFDPYLGFVMCANPKTPEAELKAFFPKDASDRKRYAGCVMVYPHHKMITGLNVPDQLLEHPYYEKHNLFLPANPKVADIEGFGTHYGTVFFKGDDDAKMRELLVEYEEFDFYVCEPAESKC